MHIKKDTFKAFYDENKQLHLEIDKSGVSLRASLLQVRDRMQFPVTKAPDNTALWPIEFTS